MNQKEIFEKISNKYDTQLTYQTERLLLEKDYIITELCEVILD